MKSKLTCVQSTLCGVNLAFLSHGFPLYLQFTALQVLLQLSKAHSAPPPYFPSPVLLELGLDVEMTLSSGHKLKGKSSVP